VAVREKVLRDFQRASVAAVLGEFDKGKTSTLLVLPTGCGKTIVMAKIAAAWERGNVLLLAHRIELLDQAADKMEPELGYRPVVEQGERGMDADCLWHGGAVLVGSVQTMRGEARMEKFRRAPFDLVLIDEAHHATAASYRKVVDYFRGLNPHVRVLGVTATPNRADDTALGIVFDSVAYEMGIAQAIDLGWLVPVEQEYVAVEEVDFSAVGTAKNDLGESDLKAADLESVLVEEEALHALARPILDKAGSRQCLVFTAGVAHAHLLAAVLNRYRDGSAKAVDGKTLDAERKAAVAAFARGELQFLTNFGVFCLDEQTEILTSDGWVGIDQVTYAHKVANWEAGEVFFEEPKFIVRRDRLPGEDMISVAGLRHNIRVTGDHRMLCRGASGADFMIRHAADLVGVKTQLPVSGLAFPLDVKPEQPGLIPDAHRLKRLRASSYVLRQNGMPPDEARAEAERRLAERETLRRKDPHELTGWECAFVGFFLAEGTRSELANGGVEYTVTQSRCYPSIIEWFDNVVARLDVDSRRREYPDRTEHGVVTWSFPRGTGSGPQRRRGLFPIEPYLDKHGTRLLWGLDRHQFGELLLGFWYGDGDHGPGNDVLHTFRLSNADKGLLDLIQAIACCRGYKTTLRPGRDPATDAHRRVWRLSLRKQEAQWLANETLQREPDWRPERVWCVTSTTGNIITRREGYVTVTGNTEGFDVPSVALVAMGRPTKSVGLYTQMLGRGTRPLPGVVDGPPAPESRRAAIAASGKPKVLVLDFVGNSRHKLVSSVDVLGGNYDAEVRELARKQVADRKGADVMKELKKARAELLLMKEQERRRGVVARVGYSTQAVDPFGHDAAPGASSVEQTRGGASDAQIAFLVGLGVQRDTAARFNRRQASAVIEDLKAKRCTSKQRAVLTKYGEDPDVPFAEASETIDAIARNGWRPLAKEAV
jgi:superfamily II DNA or RNA helicase